MFIRPKLSLNYNLSYFKLSYALDETSLLPYDTSADDLRYTLETLPVIYRVDVSRTAKSNGKFACCK